VDALGMVGADLGVEGLSKTFIDAGYECTFGDLMFSLGIPFTLHSTGSLKIFTSLLMPVVGRLLFTWVYKGRSLRHAELNQLLDQLGFEPQLLELT
jgi:hypothetical protein